MGRATLLACLLLGGCGEPYAEWPIVPAGHSPTASFYIERATGCAYYIQKGAALEPGALKPMLRPDGTQMGCRPTQGDKT